MKKTTLTNWFQNNDRNFYILLLTTFIFILFSHPFLKYPYDMWSHLTRIDSFYGIELKIYRRELWYLFWAETFHLFSIDDIFIRARVIHIIQTIISLFAVFIFSRVMIRNFFKEVNKTTLNYLSYWSALIWLSIYATFSMHYHQVWIMWYSINYQIALAFFWYITALTLILIFEKKNWSIKLFYCAQIIFFSYVMLSIHPMEIAYYFMYLFLLFAVFIDKIIYILRAKFYIVLPMILLVVISVYYLFNTYFNYKDKIPPIIQLLKNGQVVQLYENIIKNGQASINGLNRAYASINELMVVIFFIGLTLSFIIMRKKFLNKESNVNFRFFLFTIISALFVTIPLFQFSAGLSSVIFSPGVVNRLYYSSSLFVLLPIAVYYFWNMYNENVSIRKINVSIISIFIFTLLYSIFFSANHNYFKNIKSLVDSFDERKVGFVLSQENIKTIGDHLKVYEKKMVTKGKTAIYFARPDIILIIRYFYKRDVFWSFSSSNWNGRKSNKYTLEKFVTYSKNKKTLQTKIPIVFKTPDDFPDYVPYR